MIKKILETIMLITVPIVFIALVIFCFLNFLGMDAEHKGMTAIAVGVLLLCALAGAASKSGQ